MTIRRATAHDGAAIAAIGTASRLAAMPTIRWAHTDEEVRCRVADVLLRQDEVWVNETDGADNEEREPDILYIWQPGA